MIDNKIKTSRAGLGLSDIEKNSIKEEAIWKEFTRNSIKDLAVYVDVEPHTDLLKELYKFCDGKFNSFGKTKWHSFALEHKTGGDTEYLKHFEPILAPHREFHPHIQKRSTGFNLSTSTEDDLYAHSDLDFDQEHPHYFNIVIPVHGKSTIEYFQTNEDEVQMPEVNCHNEFYYHEFKNRTHEGYEEFLQERLIAQFVIDRPLLIDTNTMHRVTVQEAPRVAWVTRWINLPKEVDIHTFKDMIEEKL